ncbi:DUF4362 domain-containing protein [Gracilibacillus boraciitolerans]|uniref:DUF4362 domain-containing protein n=1 Tax=Gracilibacillus boraciitolerans TaxID=307521 RepID=UPI001F196E90|nr:DUF4362 domain-containing protein [Gracilibacillus boraciitolerans]
MLSGLLLLFIVACGTASNDGNVNGEKPTNQSEKDQNQMTGYVANVDDSQVLVIENRLDQSFDEIPIEEVYEQAGNAIYFSIEDIEESLFTSLTEGEKITVTHGTVAESYPGQSAAIEISREIDEQNDLIDMHGDYSNLIQLEIFRQKSEKDENTNLRLVRYTTEGDPIFYNLQYENDSYQVYIDATQDEFGVEDRVKEVGCQLFEYYLTEEKILSFDLQNCDNEGGQLQVANAPFADIIIPEQVYQRIVVKMNDKVLLDTTDETKKAEIINQIKEGQLQSVMSMSMIAPEGVLVLMGKMAEIRFDYYLEGNLIRYNTYINAGIKIE